MNALNALRWSLALLIAGAIGCSVVVDTSDIASAPLPAASGNTEECPPDTTKECDGKCVALDDPAYGCDPQACEPCVLANAIPKCNGPTCEVRACLEPYDCPIPSEGCAVNKLLDGVLTDVSTCSVCDFPCAEGQVCTRGECLPE